MANTLGYLYFVSFAVHETYVHYDFASISGLKQLGNDIDVIKNLRKMWDEGFYVFDAHANEVFTLHAMLLWTTIKDYPTCDSLSGYKNKGKKTSPICIIHIEARWIPKCKHLLISQRMLLPCDHPMITRRRRRSMRRLKSV